MFNLELSFKLLTALFEIVAIGAVTYTVLTYRLNTKKHQEDKQREIDRETLAQGKQSLEWAYCALSGYSDPYNNHVVPNQINWLACANHIDRYKKLKEVVKNDPYKTILAEQEEYWKHAIYISLSEIDNEEYFQKEKESEKIKIQSALTVCQFATIDEPSNEALNPKKEFEKISIDLPVIQFLKRVIDK